MRPRAYQEFAAGEGTGVGMENVLWWAACAVEAETWYVRCCAIPSHTRRDARFPPTTAFFVPLSTRGDVSLATARAQHAALPAPANGHSRDFVKGGDAVRA